MQQEICSSIRLHDPSSEFGQYLYILITKVQQLHVPGNMSEQGVPIREIPDTMVATEAFRLGLDSVIISVPFSLLTTSPDTFCVRVVQPRSHLQALLCTKFRTLAVDRQRLSDLSSKNRVLIQGSLAGCSAFDVQQIDL